VQSAEKQNKSAHPGNAERTACLNRTINRPPRLSPSENIGGNPSKPVADWLPAEGPEQAAAYRSESETNLARAQQRLEEIDAELTTPQPLPFIALERPTFEVNGWDVAFSVRWTHPTSWNRYIGGPVYPTNSD